MWRLIFMVGIVSASAVGAVTYIENSQTQVESVERQARHSNGTRVTTKPSAQAVRLSGQERIARSPRGHYEATFRINNARVHGLIDTGATTIAINESTARKAGIRLGRKDFKYPVRTANGETMGAITTIDQISIGSIRVKDVDAMVLKDESLSQTLIGMSFLNRLRGFEFVSGNLVLKR